MPIIGEYSLTPLQLGMYFQHHVTDRAGIDVVQVVGDIRHAIEPDSFERAWNDVVRDHEALRTAICSVPGEEPTAKIFSEAVAEIDFHDLTNLNREAQSQHFQKVEQLERLRPFDLASLPLMRWALFKLSEEHWRMVWTWHHIVLDGRSCILLLKQLFSHYEAELNGQHAPSMEQVAFSEYAQRVASAEMGPSIEFWRKRLHAGSAATPLPLQKPESVPSRRMECKTLCSAELTSQLRALGDRDGFTFNTAVQAAWAIVLSRYTGESDVLFGATRTTRKTIPGGDGIIGPLIATVPVLAQVNGDLPVVGLLRSLRDDWVSGRGHEHLPLPVLQGMTGIPSNQRMFDSLVLSENETFGKSMKLPGGEWNKRSFELYSMETGYLLTVLASGGENLELRILFDGSQIESEVVRRLLGHLEIVLKAIAADPEQRISQLPMLSDEEWQKVVFEFNDTAEDFPRTKCIHDFFEEQSAKTPDAMALIYNSERISYAELNQRSNRLAHYLRKRGVQRETLGGIFLTRTPELLVAILGVLKAGGAYVPLDPKYPKKRLMDILEGSGTPFVLTESGLQEDLPDFPGRVICLDLEKMIIMEQESADPEFGASPENLAYVLFTSGSTGKPKGVAIEHRSTATFLHWVRAAFSKEQMSGVLLSTSVCFDLSVFEMFGTLAQGGKIIMAENALYLPELQAKNEVTLINTVPSAMKELVRVGNIPASVKLVALAGEALSPSLVEDIYAATSVDLVMNLYGPTEDTTYSTYTALPRGAAVTIGRPIANTQAYVLDRRREPVPVGIPGELYLAGDGLARGYYGQTQLTLERFVKNPFSRDPDARMYKTGDLCRWLPEGKIDYLGRIDHQVKIRGFRVELGEIETVISEYPGVAQTVAMVREDQPGNQQIVAYFTTDSGIDLSSEQLLSELSNRLPQFMRPAAIVMMDRLPLTPNGKIDRRALPAPDYRAGVAGSREASTPTEEIIAGIWAEVLKRERVGVEEDFFALGGHSLLATQMVSRIRATFGIELPLRAPFEHATVSALARRVEDLQRKDSLGAVVPLGKMDRTNPLRLSFAQQRLWFLERLEPGNTAYYMPVGIRLKGKLDVERLKTALDGIVARHESLRTVFRMGADGEPEQVVLRASPVSLRMEDVSHAAQAEREAMASALVRDEAGRAFDLASGPLFRAMLVKVAEDEHILMQVMHHIVSDGWSLGVLSRELKALYEHSELAPLPLQYADYAKWQREYLSGEVLDAQLAYWKQKMAGAPAALDLSIGRPRPAAQTMRGAKHVAILPKELLDGLKKLSRQQGVTLFMTLLAGWQVLLSRYSRQDDIVVGSPTAGRTKQELEGLIGFFVNTLVLRTDLSGEPTFGELLKRVRETTLEAYTNQDVPFERLVEELNPVRDMGRSPLFQVMLVLQNNEVSVAEIGGLEISGYDSGTVTTKSKFDLLLDISETSEGLRCALEYDLDLFDSATIERMLEHFGALLDGCVKQPGVPVTSIDILSQSERNLILEKWNDSVFRYPEARITTFFERQVERAPHAVAVIAGTERWTYADLNARANQIAHYLQSKSIGADTLVGIFLRRSPDLVAAILGVLKAGGAYVPIDPNYPKERIQNILDDSRVSVVLTESALEQRVPRSAAQIFCLDTQQEALNKWPTRNLEIHTEPENLAYVLFTSGSTGRPKGVAIEHRNTVTFIEWCLRTFSRAELSGVAFGTSVCFDMSTFEMFVTLGAGGKVIVLENLLDLTSVQAKNEVTCINTVPSAMAELVRAGSVPESVKLVLLAGEALSPTLAQDIYEQTKLGRLFNLYGPTETGYSTFELVEKDRHITIGRPISNLKTYILDAKQRPVPIGVIGEIYIGGSGVARGYCNQPGLTAERFLPNPFADQPGARMYKTGDLGRFLEDGRIEYLGRMDHQVKIRGFRVELGEIEAIVSEHPGVAQAVAIVREDQPGNKQIVAYVTTNPGDEVSADDLLSQVAPRLPDYMRPAAIVMLDRIPLTPNGKVDRAALPAPSPRTVSHSQSLPSGSTETEIARIWEEVLGRKDIGAEDNFFVLGGHSLSAARVMSRIQHAFEIEIALRAMFDSPTIRGLSARVLATKYEHRLPLLRRLNLKRAPCSFAQQRLWLSTQIVGSNDAFNVPSVTRVRGPLDIDMLEEALSSIASRQESLRTTFDSAGEEVVQVIHDSVSIPINLIELSALKGPDRQSRCDEVILGELAKGFDLASGPLLRVTVIRLEPGDHVLVIVMHHMITDGWSLAILLEELSSFYTALSEGKEAQLPDLKIQYSDFAVWQREWLSAEVLEKQTKHWMKVLEGVTPLISLPSDRPRPVVQSHSGATCQSTIDERLTAKLKGLSQECNATLMMTLLASFQLLLSKYSGDQDITVGTDLAYRNSIETEKLIGFFVGVLPIRTKLNGDPEFRELIDRVRSASLDMYAHQDVALDKLVDALNLERTLSYNPLVQVLFVMQNTPDIVLNIPGHKTEPFRVPITRSKFDLLLFVKEANNSLILEWLYSTDLFESKTVKSMTEHYETLLRSVSVDPNLRLSNIDYRSELERERLRSDKMQDRLKKQSQLKLVKRKALDR